MSNLEKLIFNIKSNRDFEDLCLKIFDFQFKNNLVYKKYAELILNGEKPKRIQEIPFLPITLFKNKKVYSLNQNIEKIFESSGTTKNTSKHYVANLSLYKKSIIKSFEYFYGDISNYCILSLLPDYRKRQNSSLVYMVDYLIKKSKNKKSGFYLTDYKKLSESLKFLSENKQKTILIGASSALIKLAKDFPQNLNNIIVMETGGTKGGEKEILKEELHEILKTSFKLEKIHSEYGMTELLSQSYSNGNNIFMLPKWKKVFVRDIHDPFSVYDSNYRGVLNIIDLANLYSCSFIATEDLGKIHEDGTFSILGRVRDSDIRGCNLLI